MLSYTLLLFSGRTVVNTGFSGAAHPYNADIPLHSTLTKLMTTSLLVPGAGIYEYMINTKDQQARIIFWALKGSRQISQGTSCSLAAARKHYEAQLKRAV
jgi:hypothetical protein